MGMISTFKNGYIVKIMLCILLDMFDGEGRFERAAIQRANQQK